ncbi:MAG TPA: FAD-dependent monooxygenase [Burkholderiales bacterium]|nr:FAD-dependent monooxygenase [Burkholderiales bacterium]
MAAPQTDLLIRGAGPVGATLALALLRTPLRVALVHRARAPAAEDFRPIALSYASRLILERVGAWNALDPAVIRTVVVSQAQGFGRTVLSAEDAGVPALGYVVEYRELERSLHSALRREGVELLAEPRPARCQVHAEGWSDSHEKSYGQDALVARVFLEDIGRDIAHEHFMADGPLALLPLLRGTALIWTLPAGRAQALAAMPEREFLQALARSLPRGAGAPSAIEARSTQPLALRVRAARVGARELYIGNAAQTLHPVAGQGLNLGLRDAWDLAQLLRFAPDPGAPELLARYAARRRIDAQAAIRLTDGLARAFLGSGRVAAALRGAALTALDVLPAPRRFFTRRMIYGASALP